MNYTEEEKLHIIKRACSELKESLPEYNRELHFSSWMNKFMDMPEREINKNPLCVKLHEFIQARMDMGMYRIYQEELVPSDKELKDWLSSME